MGTPATITVDFTSTVSSLPIAPFSTTVSTYGSPITTDLVARNVYAKIAGDQIVRIPLQWNGGSPVSSAGGGPHDISGDDWVSAIEAMGATVMLVVGGTTDNNFSASDAANLASRYNPWAVVLGNEPGNGGMSIQTYLTTVYAPAAAAVRSAAPGVLIAGPAWAWYDTTSLQYFINNMGTTPFDILDWHNYASGTNSNLISDATQMAYTVGYETGGVAARGWLDAAGRESVQVQIGEYNLSWAGGDSRFYTKFNTAWSASAIGRMIKTGLRSLAYSQQNGDLGIMIQTDQQNGFAFPTGTPMPLFHGIGMFQGEGLFRGFGSSVKAASSNDTNIEAYAGSSGNVVIVNKTNTDYTITVSVTGAPDGSCALWRTDTASPMNVPTSSSVTLSGSRTIFDLQGYQVATLLTSSITASVVFPKIHVNGELVDAAWVNDLEQRVYDYVNSVVDTKQPPMIIGTNDASGWGFGPAGTIRNAGIRWAREEYGVANLVADACSWGFDVLGVVANSADNTLITTLNNTTQANLAVSQVQAESRPKVLEFMNEPWLKGGQAHPVKYARMYMAARAALTSAGITKPLLFDCTGDFYCEATTQSCTLSSGSPIVTMASTDEIVPLQTISGTGIPAGSYVASLNADGTHFTIGNAGSPNATTNGAQNVTFDARWSHCEDADSGWIARSCKTVSGLTAEIIANGISFHPYGMPTQESNGHSDGIGIIAFHVARIPVQLGQLPDVWISEFGYQIDGATSGATTGVLVLNEAEQAQRMSEALAILEAETGVKGIFYYESHNGGWGFMNTDNTTRQSFGVLSAAARRHSDPVISATT